MKTHDHASYYHVCTDGNALQWMFKDDEDFIAGINRIAICKLETCIEVIAYILMDNHVHFIIWGDIVQCKKFITKYKLLTGKWIKSKYGDSRHIKHLPTQFIHISNEEQLLDTIAYIDRNSVVAGYKHLPSEYPWGSARHIFRSAQMHNEPTKRLGRLSKSEIQTILKTWCDLPGDWEIDGKGMILPKHFLNISRLEGLFKSPIKYLYHLSKKLEGKIEMLQGTQAFICDKDLRIITRDIAEELYGKDTPEKLDFNSKINIARKLRYNYGSTPKQISRMINIDVDLLSKFV